MKFTVNSTVLQRSLGKLGGVIQTKSTSPILEHFLLKLTNATLSVTATDMSIWMEVSTEVSGEEDGAITIPAKRLTDTLRSLEDTDVTFEADTTTNRITVRTTSGEYNLTGDHHTQFPPVPAFTVEEEVSFDSSVLRRIIQKTTFAVSQDDLRPAMNGVLLQTTQDGITAVATDGHRLVRFRVSGKVKASTARDVIIPVKTLNVIGRSLEDEPSTVKLSKSHVQFSFGGWSVVSRLIEENYPKYESVIPAESDNNKYLTVAREKLIQSIRRVSLYASATTHQVRLDVTKDEVRIAAQDVDFGGDAKEKLACSYTDTVFLIGFNAIYLVDMLTHLDGENVVFKLSAPTKAGLLVPENPAESEDILMLVMPVRLNA